MFRGHSIGIVIPAHREERLIGSTLTGLPAWVDRVVVVDDASPDRTAERVRNFGDPRVELLVHETNRGVGAAILSGYAALAPRVDHLVVMAGDNQMDPADLEELLAPLVEGRADYVKGNRFRHPERRNMPILRRAGSRFLALMTRLVSGLDVDDTQCGYTALDARAARILLSENVWARYGYPNDVLLLLAHHGMTVVEVPVRPVYRDETSGLRPYHVLTILGVILRRYRDLASRPQGQRNFTDETSRR